MMKRLIVFALILCLTAPGAMAQDGPAPLTLQELNAFTESLLARAIDDKLAVSVEEESFVAEGLGYRLYLSSGDLSADSVLVGAVIQMDSLHTEGFTGPRGIGVTSSLEQLLGAYPNDNPDLAGTMTQAALYVRGQLPGEVSMGQVIRDGQAVSLVEHSLLAPSSAGPMLMGLQYLLEDGSVTAVRYFGGGEAVAVEEAERLVADAVRLQEETGYFAYDVQAPAELQREDLRVQGLDFLDMTPEAAQAVFGRPAHEERVKDVNGEEILITQFEGVEITFIYDGEGNLKGAERITVNLEGIEGPGACAWATACRAPGAGSATTGELPAASAALYGDAAGQVPPTAGWMWRRTAASCTTPSSRATGRCCSAACSLTTAWWNTL